MFNILHRVVMVAGGILLVIVAWPILLLVAFVMVCHYFPEKDGPYERGS